MRSPKKLLAGLLAFAVAMICCMVSSVASADDYGSYLATSFSTTFSESASAPAVDDARLDVADLPARYAAYTTTMKTTKTVAKTATAAPACSPGDQCSLQTTTTYHVAHIGLRRGLIFNRPFGLLENKPVRTFLGRVLGAVFQRGC